MTDATYQARKLLEAYRGRCPCVFPSECDTCRAQIQADITLGEKREATLAVTITLVDVAQWAARGPCICHPANKKAGAECLKDAADKALATWERLFPLTQEAT